MIWLVSNELQIGGAGRVIMCCMVLSPIISLESEKTFHRVHDTA